MLVVEDKGYSGLEQRVLESFKLPKLTLPKQPTVQSVYKISLPEIEKQKVYKRPIPTQTLKKSIPEEAWDITKGAIQTFLKVYVLKEAQKINKPKVMRGEVYIPEEIRMNIQPEYAEEQRRKNIRTMLILGGLGLGGLALYMLLRR